MKISDKLSSKIKRVSFFLSFFVLIQHSVNSPGLAYDQFSGLPATLESVIQYFIGLQLVTVTNPLFFFISGFLFFNNLNISTIGKKFLRRFFSLFVPFLIASFWGAIFAYLIVYLTRGAVLTIDHSYQLPQSISEFISSIKASLISYQLWFIKDLIVYILISPVLYLLLKKAPKLTMLGFLLIWIFNWDVQILNTDNIIFFPLGAYFATNSINFNKKVIWSTILTTGSIWFLIMSLKAYLVFAHLTNTYVLVLLHRSALLIGGFVIWKYFDFAKDIKSLIPYYRFAFFVYLFHLPYLNLIEYGIRTSVHLLPFQDTATFFATPLITFTTLIVIGKLLSNYTPNFYKLITGGR